jgi:hypothetical protein
MRVSKFRISRSDQDQPCTLNLGGVDKTNALPWARSQSPRGCDAESAAKLHEEAIKKVIGLKRTAPDDSLETHRPRKMR